MYSLLYFRPSGNARYLHNSQDLFGLNYDNFPLFTSRGHTPQPCLPWSTESTDELERKVKQKTKPFESNNLSNPLYITYKTNGREFGT